MSIENVGGEIYPEAFEAFIKGKNHFDFVPFHGNYA